MAGVVSYTILIPWEQASCLAFFIARRAARPHSGPSGLGAGAASNSRHTFVGHLLFVPPGLFKVQLDAMDSAIQPAPEPETAFAQH
jgi:hypothetical protein